MLTCDGGERKRNENELKELDQRVKTGEANFGR